MTIKSFHHKGLENFFLTGSKKGIQPAHANKLENQLGLLHQAVRIANLDLDGWNLHCLQPRSADVWSFKVNANWRLTFRFDGTDAFDVDYLDYH